MSRRAPSGINMAGTVLTGLPTSGTPGTSDAISFGQAQLQFAGIAANARNLTAASGDPVKAGYRLTPRVGYQLGFAATLYAGLYGQQLPVVGGTQTWQVVVIHADFSRTVAMTFTVADGKVGAVTNLGTPYSIVATDSIDLVCSANTAPTATPGVAPSIRLFFTPTTVSLPTAPATPTGVSAQSVAGGNTILYTLPSTATDAVIWKNGKPYDTGAAGSSYFDSAGISSDTYAVSSANLGSISAVSGTVTPTAASFSYYTTGVRNLSADTTDWTVSLGANPGTAAAVDAAGKMTLTSGNAGSGASADVTRVQWKGPDGASGKLSALRRKELVSTSTAGVLWEYYFRAQTPMGTGTTYIQVQFSTAAVRIGGKVGGGFLTWTVTGAANVTCAQQTAGGTVGLGTSALGGAMNANGTTQYTVMCEVLPVSSVDGSQTIKVYVDTAANYANPALFITLVLNSTLVGSFSSNADIHWEDVLGNQSATAASTNVTKQNVVLTPLVAVGS